MDIRPMLVRLQGALDRNDLMEKMVLLPGSMSHTRGEETSLPETNLIVGYNSSPGSQTALDLALWIAHQTRLVTRKQVTVQVVYVVDHTFTSSQSRHLVAIEQADRILWQARSLAEEWRDALKTHLRFGKIATELRQVVQAEVASVLLLGCASIYHPLVRQLGVDFPCPVLGIPDQMNVDYVPAEISKPEPIKVLSVS